MKELRGREENRTRPRLTPTSVMLLLMEFLRSAPQEVVRESDNLAECIRSLPTFEGNKCYESHYNILLLNDFINDDNSLTPKGRNFCHSASSVGVNFESIFKNGRIGFCIAGANEAVEQLVVKMSNANNTFNIYEGTLYHNNLIEMRAKIDSLLEKVVENNEVVQNEEVVSIEPVIVTDEAIVTKEVETDGVQ